MPNFKTVHLADQTTIYFWRVFESYAELRSDLLLNDDTLIKLELLKSDLQKRCLLAIRKLLCIAGYADKDLVYDDKGKPFLTDGKFISISHSFDYCAIIISDQPVGIDIEKKRSKIKRIQKKFTDVCFGKQLSIDQEITILTKIWTAKESLYKIYGKKGINFKFDIRVTPFDIEDNTAMACIIDSDKTVNYQVSFIELNDFICAYAFITNKI